ncbi:uncharacterized protein LODBEIA_P51380 [Lodderomyces beijingensis]|uniref:Uncharacterized protein n=1 Tax=Lodderomyces beijingensis TaxID=1775926 RepID=A0ABP0ZS23_9ASCO
MINAISSPLPPYTAVDPSSKDVGAPHEPPCSDTQQGPGEIEATTASKHPPTATATVAGAGAAGADSTVATLVNDFDKIDVSHPDSTSESESKSSAKPQRQVSCSYCTKERKLVMSSSRPAHVFGVYVSEDSRLKYEQSLKSKDDALRTLQQNGIGIPVLKGVFNTKIDDPLFMTFWKYYPPEFGSFDFQKDYKTFCTVKRYNRPSYDCYVFEFTPDISSPESNFSITMFSHCVRPINDYIYNGERTRWVDESKNSSTSDFKRRRFSFSSKIQHEFKHTLLSPLQPALTDDWDGSSTKLEVRSPSSLMKVALGLSAKSPGEYYGNGVFGKCTKEAKKPAVLKLRDSCTRKDMHLECVVSVGIDALVSACIVKVLLTSKSYIDNDKKRQYQLQNPNSFAA